jgi:Saccharopine dehydrogenase NADP binding domain
MISNRTVTVFGAYGHTGRFVVAELQDRGWTPILSARDPERLRLLAAGHRDMEVRPASIDSPASLDRALAGSALVINCAGPFLDTATPVIEAALRAGIHYLDVTPEQRSVLNAFEQFTDAARDARIVVVPAMAFFGGLGDLLATAAIGDWAAADEVVLAYALDSWKPTPGTRLTGKRNTGRRFVFTGNNLEFVPDPAPKRVWNFPEPFGTQDVESICLSEIVTISHHLPVSEVHAFMNLPPLRDIHDPKTPSPTASDERGRSSQTFLVDVVARKGFEERHASACGRDIYAISAPIVVEAAQRIVTGLAKKSGVVAPGEVFDSPQFLESLHPTHLSVELTKS